MTLTSVNGYSHHFSLAEAQAEQNFLAYDWGSRGEPLPASHGFPLRAPCLEAGERLGEVAGGDPVVLRSCVKRPDSS